MHEMTADRSSDLHILTLGGPGSIFPDTEEYEEWSDFSVGLGPIYSLHIGSLNEWTYCKYNAFLLNYLYLI